MYLVFGKEIALGFYNSKKVMQRHISENILLNST